MRKVSAILAGLAVVATLSTPATVEHRHHGFRGQSDSRGEGSSRGDNLQHDDPSILF